MVTVQLGSKTTIKLIKLCDNYHDRDVTRKSGCLKKGHSIQTVETTEGFLEEVILEMNVER